MIGGGKFYDSKDVPRYITGLEDDFNATDTLRVERGMGRRIYQDSKAVRAYKRDLNKRYLACVREFDVPEPRMLTKKDREARRVLAIVFKAMAVSFSK